MTQSAEKILSEALALNQAERAEIAAKILETLDPTADDGYVAAWASEIESRIREVEEGKVKTIPWKTARELIRNGLDRMAPMSAVIRGSHDPSVDGLKAALDDYEREHPGAVASLYRQNSASVRIRIIDQNFEHLSKAKRHDQVWNFLAARLTDGTLQEISELLLLAPAEQKVSFMNFEFDDPIPSGF
jgi:putative addiction module component (TIGR02574 family)